MKEIYFKDRNEWRTWLSENQDKQPQGIWLVFYKKETNQPTLGYDESVEEALCFGWIDSIIKKLDDARYARKFTPRKPDSLWSEINKDRVEKMLKQGRMTEAGLALVDAAKKSGLWEKSARPDISFDLPEEFENALRQNQQAWDFFERLAPGYQKQYIGWIAVAKRAETKAQRILESIALLEKGEKLGMK